MECNIYIVGIIVKNSVANLTEFGYPNVTKDNIFTDDIYSEFFKRMLKDVAGNGYDNEVRFLLDKIDRERSLSNGV